MLCCTRKNEGTTDRLLRASAGALLLIAAYFWLGGAVSTIIELLGIILLFTALTGSCMMYTIWGKNTVGKRPPRWTTVALWVLLLAIVIGGPTLSAFATTQLFLRNFNVMNAAYKQALYTTGNTPDDAPAALQDFSSAFSAFAGTYASYRPQLLWNDTLFPADLAKTRTVIDATMPLAQAKDWPAAHASLEVLRPVFNELLRRNGLSPVAVALSDFHDPMETVVHAAEDAAPERVIAAYQRADEKLKTVEELQSGESTKALRASLESLVAAARGGNAEALPALGAALKKSYHRAYFE